MSRIFKIMMNAMMTLEEPSSYFNMLDGMNGLEKIFPEIYALKGRIQPEKWHPEGDAYVHTMLVIDRAKQLGADEITMFAALCHDFGKAVTPDHELPHHFNHEGLGVPIIKEFCERLDVPEDYCRAACATSKEHLNIHRFSEMKPVKRVRLLKRLSAENNNELLDVVTLASQADAQGRGPDFINKPYPQREAVLTAAIAFRRVDASNPQKLEQMRAKAIQ